MLPPYTKQIHYPPTPLWYCGTSRVSWQASRQQNMCQTSLGFSMLSRIEKVKDIPMRFSFFSNLWSFWEVGWICKKVLQKSQEFAGLNSTKKGLYVAPSKKKGSFATYFGQIKGGEPTRQLLYDDFNDKNLIFYEGPQTTFEEAKKNLLGPPWFYPKTTTRHKNQRHLEVLEGSNVMTMTRQLVYQILNDKNSIFNKCSQNRILKPWEFFIWPLTKKASFVTFFGQIKGRSLWMSTWRVIKGERYAP